MAKPGGKKVYSKLFENNEIVDYIDGYWLFNIGII